MIDRLHLNARFLTQPLSGTQRYAEQLVTELDRLADGVARMPRITAWCPPGERREPGWRNIELRSIGRLRGHLWEQIELPWAARGEWLLNLVSSAPLLHSRQIVALHDAAVLQHPDHFSRRYGMVHRTLRPLLARRSRLVVTVSHFSREALSVTLRLPPDRFAIVPNGSDHLSSLSPDRTVLDRHGLVAGSYVLFVGNEAPHKNVGSAIAAFGMLEDLDLRFVTVGIGRSEIFGRPDLSGDRRILRLHDVTDSQLRCLYEDAGLLVFPSRYEGFGIPPLEAMSLGCPVVSSNAAALPEVVGNAALLVDPDDVGGFADAMRRLLSDSALRQEMIERGHARSRHFTWRRSAEQLLQLLSYAES